MQIAEKCRKICVCEKKTVPLQPFLKITTHHINALRSSCEPSAVNICRFI